MMSCAKAARLMSDRMNQSLSRRLRVALRVHLLMCAGCRRYEKQLQLLQRWLKSSRLAEVQHLTSRSVRLGDKARARIQHTLRRRMENPNESA